MYRRDASPGPRRSAGARPGLPRQLEVALTHGLHGAVWVVWVATLAILLLVACFLPARVEQPGSVRIPLAWPQTSEEAGGP